MRKRITPCLILLLLLATSCEKIDNTQETADIPVVQAFLVPGQAPVITITRIIPYASTTGDTVAIPISNLKVELTVKGIEYTLLEDSAGSGDYTLAKGDSLISAGDTVKFYAEYKGTILSASTTMPTATANLSISSEVLYYTTGDPSSWLSAGEIELTWDNPQEDYYYITVQNIESDPTALNSMAEEMSQFSSSTPSTGDQFKIGMRNITYFGTHQVIVYHVNQEFAELFDNPGMSSVSLTEASTNITNGLGVFTGLCADTLYFEVKKK